MEGEASGGGARDILLSEIQHRVRNSLSLVTSFLNLQAADAADPSVRDALSKASGRVLAIARLHDRLYRLENLREVDLGECLADVARGVEAQAGPPANVDLVVDVAPLSVSGAIAFPVGLIVNELLTNSYKYAFPGNRPGRIRLGLDGDGARAHVVVADTGIGYPRGARAGLGTRVTRALTHQIGGSLRRLDGDGCAHVLSFSPNGARTDGANTGPHA